MAHLRNSSPGLHKFAVNPSCRRCETHFKIAPSLVETAAQRATLSGLHILRELKEMYFLVLI